ncbi:glycoside hydrolase family 76 protein [Larkinella insperata]|uniref:Glycoside hydrolase family 76 protein n=1 Tax=Larkinella insperata TaxID=332158 RepID=A0ABW3QGN5_9BACT
MKNFLFYGLWLVAAATLVTACDDKPSPSPVAEPDTTKPTVPTPTVSRYRTAAQKSHAYVLANLLTPYKSYRVNATTDPTSAFEWYNTSQIYADAAMVSIGETSHATYMNDSFNWMSHFWDDASPIGGYFGFVRVDGSEKGSDSLKYIDDNALSGVVYLDAYEVSTGAVKAAYLDKAKACANWLIKSGAWDTTFDGGFWWNTAKTVKPTQSNGLAMQLFARLYILTGEAVYREWATAVDKWLSTKLYESSTGLFVWQIDRAGKRFTEKFTYDNAIMVEAFLVYGQAMKDPSYLVKAQALGNAMNRTLWDKTHNVYIFNTSDLRVTPAWCGWGSQAMIKLYEADQNTAWLGYAQGNIDAINTVLRDPASHGYYQFASLNGAGRYANIEGVDVAWMQRIQALLSKYR